MACSYSSYFTCTNMRLTSVVRKSHPRWLNTDDRPTRLLPADAAGGPNRSAKYSFATTWLIQSTTRRDGRCRLITFSLSSHPLFRYHFINMGVFPVAGSGKFVISYALHSARYVANKLKRFLFYAGKVHGSLARAGKVRGQAPKVAKQDKKKLPKGRAFKRVQYNRRFVNVGTISCLSGLT